VPIGKLTALPEAPCHNWFKGGLRGRREWRGLWEKVAKEENKGETERGGNREGE